MPGRGNSTHKGLAGMGRICFPIASGWKFVQGALEKWACDSRLRRHCQSTGGAVQRESFWKLLDQVTSWQGHAGWRLLGLVPGVSSHFPGSGQGGVGRGVVACDWPMSAL